MKKYSNVANEIVWPCPIIDDVILAFATSIIYFQSILETTITLSFSAQSLDMQFSHHSNCQILLSTFPVFDKAIQLQLCVENSMD